MEDTCAEWNGMDFVVGIVERDLMARTLDLELRSWTALSRVSCVRPTRTTLLSLAAIQAFAVA